MNLATDTLGGRIKFARTYLGIRQNELAELSGIPLSSVRGYEADRVQPSLFNITCIADVLRVSLDWLAGREEMEWIDTSLMVHFTRLKNSQR